MKQNIVRNENIAIYRRSRMDMHGMREIVWII